MSGDRGVLSSVVLAVDRSRSTPDVDSALTTRVRIAEEASATLLRQWEEMRDERDALKVALERIVVLEPREMSESLADAHYDVLEIATDALRALVDGKPASLTHTEELT